LYGLGVIYWLNSVSGEVYVLNKARHTAPFSDIATFLSPLKRTQEERQTILVPISFWFAIPTAQYSCIETVATGPLISSASADYVITIQSAVGSPTVFKKEKIYADYTAKYARLHNRLRASTACARLMLTLD